MRRLHAAPGVHIIVCGDVSFGCSCWLVLQHTDTTVCMSVLLWNTTPCNTM